jgi:hypothetical protein
LPNRFRLVALRGVIAAEFEIHVPREGGDAGGCKWKS